MNYSEQKNWKRIITFLPGKYHFNKEYYPSEEHWDWKGNHVHLVIPSVIRMQRLKLSFYMG